MMGRAVIVILAGAALAALVARQIATGKAYTISPPMAVTRKEDSLSFWLSLLIPASFAVGLMIAGALGLWHALNSN